ncbi:MAG: hypothetical protein U9R03_04525 [Candidatus Aerophobetes bacterium]|nr:hypothetical protein [Candidatus Aerophobetes bacterium]
MSKIIVDQIKSSTGDTLTVPVSDGNTGDVIITDGSGNLEFKSVPSVPNTFKDTILGIPLPSKEALIQSPIDSVIVGDIGCHCATSGCSCIWTVPVGVTEAEFQVWGAGGNGNGCSGACCGFGSGGGNGEYTYVKMKVQEGDTYTLCAGGAYGQGSCYSYTACDGCNSFVCGSNNTCIMSCGGTKGYGSMCGSVTRTLYPKTTHNYASARTGSQHKTSNDQCSGIHHGRPEFRCEGRCVGGFSSSNEISVAAKVPSLRGGTMQCGNSICYMCYSTIAIKCDHTIGCYGTGWNGNNGGCCMDVDSVWDSQPGVGGAAPIQSCNLSTYYGGRGRSGMVKVNYK